MWARTAEAAADGARRSVGKAGLSLAATQTSRRHGRRSEATAMVSAEAAEAGAAAAAAVESRPERA
eukprot:1270014-Pleurochrysis_carterae.AAC.1